jgi:tetratricopeptide (TPR) repeat protein
MYKAFLAHSSKDKAYVDVVARKLSRARVVYDRQDFEPGLDFRDSIRRGLDESALFVLFASSESLKSTWVRFEIDEAELRRLSGKLQGALAFIIDPRVTFEDLPEWMRRGRVAVEPRPTQASRIIQTQLIYQVGREAQPLFVGREDLLRKIAQGMVPSGGERPPQVIVASGLDGVVRRSAIRRALRDNLSLDFGPVILLDENDGLDKLYVLLLEETRELRARSELAAAVARFRASDLKQRCKLVAEELGVIAKDNVATVVVDEGSLIDEEGGFIPELTGVMECLGDDSREPYLVLVRRRRPAEGRANYGQARLATFPIPPLDLDATKRLLARSLKPPGSADQINELAPYLDGYPPAVQLAVDFAQLYGLDALLADKSILVDFKVRTFARILERLNLSPEEQTIVRVLGLEPAISIDVLSTMTEMPVALLAPALRRFIDRSIVVQDSGRFSLAAPLRAAVYRAYGLLGRTDFAAMAGRLMRKYWMEPEQVPPLDAVDATMYATARGSPDELAQFGDIILPSELLNIAVNAYHEREWQAAQDFAERALNAGANTERSYSTLCKAAAQLAHDGKQEWRRAVELVQTAERLRVRGHQYLRGFMEWKRGNLEAAVAAYGAAERAGIRHVGVFRDRAHCLYLLGRIDEAEKDVAVALDRDPRNKFVVDLAAKIAIARGQLDRADEMVSDLEKIDTPENFHHRRASLRSARRQWEAALADSEIACLRKPPLHEILALRVDILIELARYERASEEIEELSKSFGGRQASDVQFGLRCKLALRRRSWREAEEQYRHMSDRDSDIHRAIRLEILRQKQVDQQLSRVEQAQAGAEFAELEKTATPRAGWLDFGDADDPDTA